MGVAVGTGVKVGVGGRGVRVGASTLSRGVTVTPTVGVRVAALVGSTRMGRVGVTVGTGATSRPGRQSITSSSPRQSSSQMPPRVTSG